MRRFLRKKKARKGVTSWDICPWCPHLLIEHLGSKCCAVLDVEEDGTVSECPCPLDS